MIVHPSSHLSLYRIDLCLALPCVAIDYEPCVVALRVGESEVDTAGGCGELGLDAVVEGDGVVVRPPCLVVMTELCATLGGVDNQAARLGEECIHSIVAHPRRALVRLPEATNFICIVEVLKPFTIGACLWCPHMDSIGHRGGWEGVAVAKAEVGVSALKCVHILRQVGLSLSAYSQCRQKKYTKKNNFQFHYNYNYLFVFKYINFENSRHTHIYDDCELFSH